MAVNPFRMISLVYYTINKALLQEEFPKYKQRFEREVFRRESGAFARQKASSGPERCG